MGSMFPPLPRPTGRRAAPPMADYAYEIFPGAPALRSTIFGDLDARNFENEPPEPRTVRRGLYVHLGYISPAVHKVVLEAKYGIATEYVDELQQKWQQYKAEDPWHQFPFDPLLPDPEVWNDFYLDTRDAIMSEIFTECFTDMGAFVRFMDAVEPFCQVRIDNVELRHGYAPVTRNLARIVGNDEVAYSPEVFDYLALLVQRTAPFERVDAQPLAPEEKAALDRIAPEGSEGVELIPYGPAAEDVLTYLHRYKYVGRVFVTWLKAMIAARKPSPCSGFQHLMVAREMLPTLQNFPTYAPAETFRPRFHEYRRTISRFADWMRVKLSREDYLLRLKYAHEVVLPLPGQALPQTLSPGHWPDDEWVEILCVFWEKLHVKPEPWMRPFTVREEDIRGLARRKAVTAGDQIPAASGQLANRDDPGPSEIQETVAGPSRQLANRDNVGASSSKTQETAAGPSRDAPKERPSFFSVVMNPASPVANPRQTDPELPQQPHPDPQVRVSSADEPPVQTMDPLHLLEDADIAPPGTERPERRTGSEAQSISGQRGQPSKQATDKGKGKAVSKPLGQQRFEPYFELIEDRIVAESLPSAPKEPASARQAETDKGKGKAVFKPSKQQRFEPYFELIEDSTVAEPLPSTPKEPTLAKQAETDKGKGKAVSKPLGQQRFEPYFALIEDRTVAEPLPSAPKEPASAKQAKDVIVMSSDEDDEDDEEVIPPQKAASTKPRARRSLPKQPPREKRPALEPLEQARPAKRARPSRAKRSPAKRTPAKRTPAKRNPARRSRAKRSPEEHVSGGMDLRARSDRRPPFPDLPELEDDDAAFKKEMQDLLRAEDEADSEFVP